MNFEKYINIPYKHLGRDFSGTDCYGLIWLIYKEEKNIILPDDLTYSKFWSNDLEKNELDKNHLLDGIVSCNNKVEVQKPYNVFDMIFFWNKSRSFVDHAGMLVDINKFIHTYRTSSSQVNRLEGYWDSRIWKTYKLRGK